MAPTRRQFVKQAAAVGLGGYLAGCKPRSRGRAAAALAALRTFTPAQFPTLAAACERLFPRDEDPGAIDLDVPIYADRALAEPALAELRASILGSFHELDDQARARFGRRYHQLPPAQQDEILSALQHGSQGAQQLFAALLTLVIEGAFSDPKYGGNRGRKGFALINFDPGSPMPSMHRHKPL